MSKCAGQAAKHQYCLNSGARSKYAVINLINTQHKRKEKKKLFSPFIWLVRHFSQFKKFQILPTKYDYAKSKWINPTCTWMQHTLRSHAHKELRVLLLYRNSVRDLLLGILNSDWLQHDRLVCVECMIKILSTLLFLQLPYLKDITRHATKI